MYTAIKNTREQLALTQQSKEPLDNKNKDFLVMVKKVSQTI